MKSLIAGLAVAALSVGAATSLAQQQRKYEVDPQTKCAVGQTDTADELKSNDAAPSDQDFRPPANFAQNYPVSINGPLDRLEAHLNKSRRDLHASQ